jgi:hypothetical protein
MEDDSHLMKRFGEPIVLLVQDFTISFFYPALTIFALYSNYKYAKEFQKLPWDLDGGPQVRGKAIGFIRHAFGFCLALVCAFAYFVIRQIIVKHSFRRDFIGN